MADLRHLSANCAVAFRHRTWKNKLTHMAKAAASKHARSTPSARKAKAALTESWQQRRDTLRAELKTQPLQGVSSEEIEAHFAGMPAHYWDQVSLDELGWGLQTIHAFFKLVTEADGPGTKPIMESRPLPDLGRTRIMLCTWDRLGLVAKAAAAFSALGLNVYQAELFTRADNIVLDFFTVADTQNGGIVSEAKLREVLFLLEGSLSEPPRFASVWLNSRHKFILPASPAAPRISFDNDTFEAATLVRLEAADRLGLLCDLFEALANFGLNITEAHIATEDGMARDIVLVQDAQGHKVLAPEQLKELKQKLEAALTISA